MDNEDMCLHYKCCLYAVYENHNGPVSTTLGMCSCHDSLGEITYVILYLFIYGLIRLKIQRSYGFT